MRFSNARLLANLLVLLAAVTARAATAESPTPSPAKSPKLAPFKERLANAETVKVKTDILGVVLDSSLKEAHDKLDSLGDVAQPAVEATEEERRGEKERKVLWQLQKSDFRSVLVKTDDKDRILYLAGFLRTGKEIPFNQIGEIEKAPILTERTVAWDVVKPGQPLIRVIAKGEKRKANSIILFIVKRPLVR